MNVSIHVIHVAIFSMQYLLYRSLFLIIAYQYITFIDSQRFLRHRRWDPLADMIGSTCTGKAAGES